MIGQLHLRDPLVHENPYPTYAALRAARPVFWDERLGAWVLTRYADVLAAYRAPNRFSSQTMGRRAASQHDATDPVQQQFVRIMARMMLFADPPVHTRLRAFVSKAFTPRIVERLRPRVAQLCEELLDVVDAPGEVEFIAAFASALPVLVIGELLGVPTEERARLRLWSDQHARTLEPSLPLAVRVEAMRHGLEMLDYLTGIAEARRRDPRDDLISALVAAEDGPRDRLTGDDLVSMLGFLFVAGNETTTNLLSNGLLLLLRHPEALQALRATPALLPTAIEEMLRYEAPIQFGTRVLTEDVTLDGETMRSGDTTLLLIAAANHDPAQFPDPERFDIGRQPNAHLSFAHGVHHCIGAPLARLEGEVAFTALLRRFSHLAPADRPLVRKPDITLRGIESMWIVVRPDREGNDR